ncbi:MAG: GntR family transcriptional regulator, partial [Victivallaceae bacterium]
MATRSSIHQQLLETFRNRVSGLPIGSQFPTEHELCAEFGVSRATINKVMVKLTEDKLISRTPRKGTFVLRPSRPQPIRLALVFPEAEISQDSLDYANWAADNEIWRGMLSACPQPDAVLSFLHCSPKGDLAYFENFADNLRLQFDGALFIDSQLSALQAAMDTMKFPFISTVEGAKNNVGYDRSEACGLAASHLLECGCKNISLIGMEHDLVAWPQKKSVFRSVFANAG